MENSCAFAARLREVCGLSGLFASASFPLVDDQFQGACPSWSVKCHHFQKANRTVTVSVKPMQSDSYFKEGCIGSHYHIIAKNRQHTYLLKFFVLYFLCMTSFFICFFRIVWWKKHFFNKSLIMLLSDYWEGIACSIIDY